MAPLVEVSGLRKTYGDVVAVDDISFDVEEGEIFGLVGPNGAGKTTTVECIEGLRTPTAGTVRIFGVDPSSERRAVAERIGVQLQESALPARIRVGEAMALFASLYRTSVAITDLLETLGLDAKRNAHFASLSGGQKQRLFIALALINHPEVAFFDELTTGLDPQARHTMWDRVRAIRDDGCTVVLTTHYMEEAERLCDRVMIVDHGRVVALDSPEALIGALRSDKRIIFTLVGAGDMTWLESLPEVVGVEQAGPRVVVFGRGDRFASVVVGALEDAGTVFRDLRTEQPDLEDVFLALTGEEMRQ